jgi:methyl-accepting chemotaxis protein
MPRFSLRSRLLLLALLPALAVGCLAALGGATGVRRALDEQAAAAVSRAGEMGANETVQLARAMNALAQTLAVRPDVVEAIAAGDRERVAALLVPAYERFRVGDPRLRILEVTDANGRVLLRGHNPPRHGDDKSAVPDVAAALQGREGIGSVVSPATGEVAIGATLPIRRDGRIVGTLKAAGYLDAATARQVARASGGEVALIGAGRLRETTIQGLDLTALPDRVQAAIRDGVETVVAGSVAGRPFNIATRPMRDLSGNASAAIVLLLPTAPFEAVAWQAIVWIIGSAGAVLVLASIVGVVAARRVAGPLGGLAGAMTDLAAGRDVPALPGAGRTDEVGRMAGAVAVFRDAMAERARLAAQEVADREARERRQADRTAATQQFAASIGGIVGALGEAAGDMRRAASEMADAAERTKDGTAASRSGAEASAQSLGAVAGATEQLSASVGEISRRVAESADAAGAAVERASATDATVRGLSEAANEIGAVVRLIADIAGRTNLLALNATIEAARAGDAGKGFAVVASEVKALASQTAKATDDISRQVSAIQMVTQQAVDAIGSVSGAIERVSGVSTAIAAAVEEQGAATTQISEQVRTIAERTGQASEEIAAVARTAEQSGAAGRTVLSAAAEVARVSESLRTEVDRFLAAVGVGTPAATERRAA